MTFHLTHGVFKIFTRGKVRRSRSPTIRKNDRISRIQLLLTEEVLQVLPRGRNRQIRQSQTISRATWPFEPSARRGTRTRITTVTTVPVTRTRARTTAPFLGVLNNDARTQEFAAIEFLKRVIRVAIVIVFLYKHEFLFNRVSGLCRLARLVLIRRCAILNSNSATRRPARLIASSITIWQRRDMYSTLEIPSAATPTHFLPLASYKHFISAISMRRYAARASAETPDSDRKLTTKPKPSITRTSRKSP